MFLLSIITLVYYGLDRLTNWFGDWGPSRKAAKQLRRQRMIEEEGRDMYPLW